MAKQSGITLSGFLFGFLLLLALVYWFKPNLFDGIIDREWSLEERRRDPDGFLTYSQLKLEKGVKELRDNLDELRALQSQLNYNKKMTEDKSLKGRYYLEKAKPIFKTAEARGPSAYPVDFINSRYTRDEFKGQIKLLLVETDTLDKQLFSIQNQLIYLDRKAPELQEKLATYEAILDSIPTQRLIIKTDKTTEGIEKTIQLFSQTLASLNNTISNLKRVKDFPDNFPDTRGSGQESVSDSNIEAKLTAFLNSPD